MMSAQWLVFTCRLAFSPKPTNYNQLQQSHHALHALPATHALPDRNALKHDGCIPFSSAMSLITVQNQRGQRAGA